MTKSPHLIAALVGALCATPLFADQMQDAATIATLSRDADPRYSHDISVADHLTFRQLSLEGCQLRSDVLEFSPTGDVRHLAYIVALNGASIRLLSNAHAPQFEFFRTTSVAEETDEIIVVGIASFWFDAPLPAFSSETHTTFEAGEPVFNFRQIVPATPLRPDLIKYQMQYAPREQTVIDLIAALEHYILSYCPSAS